MTTVKTVQGHDGSALPGSACAWTLPVHNLDGDLDLQKVAYAARTLTQGHLEAHCGLSVSYTGKAPDTLAATSDLPVRVDWLQHQLQQGPLVNAPEDKVLISEDLAADGRWPDFGRLCVAVLNVRSMISILVPLAGDRRARLNFYAAEPAALEGLDVADALRVAERAAPAISRALEELQKEVVEPERGDHSQVAVALGIIMALYRVNSGRAFEMLLDARQDDSCTLVDAARNVVDGGALPVEALRGVRLRHQGHGSTGQQAGQSAARDWLSNEAGPARARTNTPAIPPVGRDRPGTPAGAGDGQHIGGPEMWRAPISGYNRGGD